MGVFDTDGNVLPDSLLDRRAAERGAAAVLADIDVDRSATIDQGIYCGPLYNHFGHFLLESLARVWFAAQQPDVPLVWVGGSAWSRDVTLRGWQREILDILRIANPWVIATTPSPVGRLYMPDIGYRADDWFHPQHAEFLGRYRGPEQDQSVRLWLSRSRLDKDVRDLNAAPLERRLRSAGWTVAHPEQRTVREQLDDLARASVVAGEEGSAFHALMLLDEVRGKKLHVIRRRGGEHRNMRTVGEARGLDQTFHSLENEVVVKATGRYVTKASAGPSEVLDLLGVPVAASDSDASASAASEIVNTVALKVGAKSLLEVDCEHASVIPRCGFSRATAVCEEFAFDPRAYASSRARFYELPIRHYLAWFGDWGGYDVIRVSVASPLAGLRAVVATQPLASRECVWLMPLPDDDRLTDEFLCLLRQVAPWLLVRTFAHEAGRHAAARIGGWVTEEWELATVGGCADPSDHVLEAIKDLDAGSLDAALQALMTDIPSRHSRVSDPAIVELRAENRNLRRRVRRLRKRRRRAEATSSGWRRLVGKSRDSFMRR